jgi:hypothetical protein
MKGQTNGRTIAGPLDPDDQTESRINERFVNVVPPKRAAFDSPFAPAGEMSRTKLLLANRGCKI